MKNIKPWKRQLGNLLISPTTACLTTQSYWCLLSYFVHFRAPSYLIPHMVMSTAGVNYAASWAGGGIFDCWGPRWCKRIFVSLPQRKPQQLQRVNMDWLWWYCLGKSMLICAGSLSPRRLWPSPPEHLSLALSQSALQCLRKAQSLNRIGPLIAGAYRTAAYESQLTVTTQGKQHFASRFHMQMFLKQGRRIVIYSTFKEKALLFPPMHIHA